VLWRLRAQLRQCLNCANLHEHICPPNVPFADVRLGLWPLCCRPLLHIHCVIALSSRSLFVVFLSSRNDRKNAADNEMIRQWQFPDVTAPPEPGTHDRFQALAFLRTMEDLMVHRSICIAACSRRLCVDKICIMPVRLSGSSCPWNVRLLLTCWSQKRCVSWRRHWLQIIPTCRLFLAFLRLHSSTHQS
jgi:hypothetical protein